MRADLLFVQTDLPPVQAGAEGLYPLGIVTLWHVWQLQVLESPYAQGGRLTDYDRLTAALVTMHSRESWLVGNANGDVPDDMLDLTKAFSALSEDEKQAYRAYIDGHLKHCFDWPEYWQERGKSGSLKCPFVWHVVRNMLTMRICQTEAEAWAYPAARAMCWTAVENEAHGGKNYVSQAERDAREKLKEAVNG